MSSIKYNAPAALGNATVSDVIAPKTFSSMAAGVGKVGTYVPREAIGNATAADVRIGVTFSSSTVLGGVGTLIPGVDLDNIRFYPNISRDVSLAPGQSMSLWTPALSSSLTPGASVESFLMCETEEYMTGWDAPSGHRWDFRNGDTVGQYISVNTSNNNITFTNNGGANIYKIIIYLIYIGTGGW